MVQQLQTVFDDDNLRELFLFYMNGEAVPAASLLGMNTSSDGEKESYGWLSAAPGLREWKGNRLAHRLSEFKYELANQLFESALREETQKWRRMKSDQVERRVAEMARKANKHWDNLLGALIANADALPCYDGQFFFDTDHAEVNSGAQSNKITRTGIGTPTAPTPAEFRDAIFASVEQLLGLKDSEGDYINEDGGAFLVMVPLKLWQPAASALYLSTQLEGGESVNNVLQQLDGITFRLMVNPRLSAWTTKFATFRTDTQIRPFILQEEVPVTTKFLGLDSEHAITNREVLFTAEASRAVGFGFWQFACQTIFSS